MCAYAIRQLRIGFVVYGIDTQITVDVNSIRSILTDPDLDIRRPVPAVIGKVLWEESEGKSSLQGRTAPCASVSPAAPSWP
jgi:tRNA(Arg) A34 adenosine deaminase TadA